MVYAAGGAMRGVFGAGALHALAEMGARDHLLALYGISAGAFNIAHFALGSTTRAMEWYLHYVPKHGIVNGMTPGSLLRGEDVINMPEAERVLDAEHLIDAEKLQGCAVPVSFGVVEREGLRFRWLDARRIDAVQLLLASSTIFPFVREPVVIDGVPCIDGGFLESVCYTRLRREYPEAKLMIVLNNHEDESMVRRMAAGVLRFVDERLAKVYLESVDRAKEELREAKADSRALVLSPDDQFPVHLATTDTAALAHGFWLGYRSVLTQRDRVSQFLGLPAVFSPT